MFLEISQSSQENTCARVSFLIRPATVLKQRLWYRCFLVNFAKYLRRLFFIEHRQETASVLVKTCLNSDLYFIYKTIGTALLETIVSYTPFPSLSQKDRNPRPSWVMILKLSKKVHFFDFVPTSTEKSKYIKAIYIYASGRSYCLLCYYVIVYYAIMLLFIMLWLKVLEILVFEIEEFC